MGQAMLESKTRFKFTLEIKREYFQLLQAGGRPRKSALLLGIPWRAVKRRLKKSARFAEAFANAECDGNEKVEEALFNSALSGNVQACQAWLYNRMPERWKDMRKIDKSINLNKRVHHEQSIRIEQTILSDPESVEITHRLLERIANGQAVPGGPGLLYQSPFLDSLQAPQFDKPKAGGRGKGPDQTASSDAPSGPRQVDPVQ